MEFEDIIRVILEWEKLENGMDIIIKGFEKQMQMRLLMGMKRD